MEKHHVRNQMGFMKGGEAGDTRTEREDPASQGDRTSGGAKGDGEMYNREGKIAPVHGARLSRGAHSASRLFRESEVSFIRAVKNLALVRRALTEIRLE